MPGGHLLFFRSKSKQKKRVASCFSVSLLRRKKEGPAELASLRQSSSFFLFFTSPSGKNKATHQQKMFY